MNFIVNLSLNETGRKALCIEVKTIYMNAENKEAITAAMIDKEFPIVLVKEFDVTPSFLELPVGSYVAVVSASGDRFLGEIINGWYKNRVNVKVHNDDAYASSYSTEFHPNGVEVTHSKSKLHIENITDEEVAKMKDAIKNKPFIAMLNMLLENSGVNAEEIKMPEWLSFETVEKITEMLKDDSVVYYD
jgi:hypothetical protein